VKLKAKGLYETIQHVRLKRSDLRRIVECLASGGPGEVEIETDDHVFDNIEEFLASEDPTKRIEFKRTKPHVTITIGTYAVEIYAEAGNAPLGIASRLRDVIAPRKLRELLPTWLMIVIGISIAALSSYIRWIFKADLAFELMVLALLALLVSVVTFPLARRLRPIDGPIRFRAEQEPLRWRAIGYEHWKILVTAVICTTLGVVGARMFPPHQESGKQLPASVPGR
jgi:hypothetical protein